MKAILSKTTTDKIKSRILSPEICELVFEVYMTPQEYATIMDELYEKEFDLIIPQISRNNDETKS